MKHAYYNFQLLYIGKFYKKDLSRFEMAFFIKQTRFKVIAVTKVNFYIDLIMLSVYFI